MLYEQDIPPETEAQIRKDCDRFGEPLPKRIAERPELFLGLALYYNAWHDLDSERQVNDAGVGRIPITAMLTYAKAFGLSTDQTSDLCRYLRQMDAAYIKYLRDKAPKPPKPGKGAKGKRK